jgi:hypothetical protein
MLGRTLCLVVALFAWPALPPAKAQSLPVVAPKLDCPDLRSFELSGPVAAKVRISPVKAVADGRPAPYCRVPAKLDWQGASFYSSAKVK